MSDASRQTVMERFSLETEAAGMLKLYGRILGSHADGS